MDKKFDLQNYLATIPQINDEKDIENLFNVMNVVANLSIPIGQKTALLNQMESKLKDNPKFQEIADSHKPQVEKMQQVMANLVQNLEEKKEHAKKQQQEIKTGQQFNLQQLNMLKGYELYKYVMDNMTNPSQWKEMTKEQQKEVSEQTYKAFLKNPTEKNTENLAKVILVNATNTENINKALNDLQSFQPTHPTHSHKLSKKFKNKDFCKQYFGIENATKEQIDYYSQIFITATEIGDQYGVKIQINKDGSIRTDPDDEESRIKYKKILDKKIATEQDPQVKEAFQHISAQMIKQEIERNKTFDDSKKIRKIKHVKDVGGFIKDVFSYPFKKNELFNKPADELYHNLSNRLDQAFDIYKKFGADSVSKWDIINIVKSEQDTRIGQLLNSQLILYMAGDKDAQKDVINNAFFRNLYAKSQAYGNDHYLFKTVLEGMNFDEAATARIISLLDKDLENNPAINPDHTKINREFFKHYQEKKDNYYTVAMAVENYISKDEGIKSLDVYDMFNRLNNGEKLTEKDIEILMHIKSLQDEPHKRNEILIDGNIVRVKNSDILDKFNNATHLDSKKLDQLIQNYDQPKEVEFEHMSESEKKILAVADIKKSKEAVESYSNNNYNKQEEVNYSSVLNS
ncbi:hypothetical protein [Lonepinella sp. BR2271]|uniref:hypothetical protein n=1 Tax=Lonepinella sp. BR2271 TaxID=3434550 RepID=UPI003F6DFD37